MYEVRKERLGLDGYIAQAPIRRARCDPTTPPALPFGPPQSSLASSVRLYPCIRTGTKYLPFHSLPIIPKRAARCILVLLPSPSHPHCLVHVPQHLSRLHLHLHLHLPVPVLPCRTPPRRRTCRATQHRPSPLKKTWIERRRIKRPARQVARERPDSDTAHLRRHRHGDTCNWIALSKSLSRPLPTTRLWGKAGIPYRLIDKSPPTPAIAILPFSAAYSSRNS